MSALVGCAAPNVPEGTPLRLYDANAKFVTSGYGESDQELKFWYPLATYRHKNNGEAPYVEVGQFLDALNKLLHNRIDFTSMTSTRITQYDSSIAKVSEHLYGIYSESTLGALINTEENIFDIKRYDYMFVGIDSFNGTLRNDVAAPNYSKESLVYGSMRSKYYGEFTNEVYDLDDYNMDIVEMDNKVYMPAQLLSNMFFRGTGADIVYNGNDYFLSNSVGTSSGFPHLEGSFRSGNNTFEIGGTLHESVTPVSGETYRYAGINPTKEGEPATYEVFSLGQDGHGYVYNASSISGVNVEGATHKLDWTKSGGDLYITLYAKDTTGGFAANGNMMRISSNQTYFNTKVRSQALSEFNYQLLRFQVDNYYGLKDELAAKHGFRDFDSFVTQKNLKEKLLSTDSRVYDEGLSEFLMKYIDDGHTRYTDRSVFSSHEEVKGTDLANRYMGPRRTALLGHRTEYMDYRKSVLGADANPIGLFMEGETAVIRFDGFNHLLTLISNPGSAMDFMDLPTLLNASSPFGFMRAFDELSKHSEIKNVVLDLTCNGGGMVLTLPFLAAYFAKDPILYVKDNLGGVVREFHYDVDLNMDGVHHGAGDYYGDKYHFYILTSDFSFSCASALPTMAHIPNVDVIGIQGGGGACNVAGFTDACGSIYTMSAPQQIGYLDKDGNFVNDDAGIPVTHELAKENWYDLVKLNKAVKEFSATK